MRLMCRYKPNNGVASLHMHYKAATKACAKILLFYTINLNNSSLFRSFSNVFFVLTALHGMQTRSSDENSVRLSVSLSVRLSNACIVTKRKKNLSRFLYHTKEHLA